MEDSRNLDRIRLDLIDGDVRQRRKCKFAASGHATAGSSQMGGILQAGASVKDGSSNAAGSFGVVAFDPFADAL